MDIALFKKEIEEVGLFIYVDEDWVKLLSEAEYPTDLLLSTISQIRDGFVLKKAEEYAEFLLIENSKKIVLKALEKAIGYSYQTKMIRENNVLKEVGQVRYFINKAVVIKKLVDNTELEEKIGEILIPGYKLKKMYDQNSKNKLMEEIIAVGCKIQTEEVLEKIRDLLEEKVKILIKN